jgi:hypothetical protein
VNSVAPPRLSIVLPTKVVASPVGMSFPRIPPTTLPPTSLLPRETLRRAMILNFTVGLPPLASQKRRRRRLSRSPTLIGYGSSSTNPHCVLVSASICAKTFVKRTCRSGSRLRSSRRSSASLRALRPPAHPVELQRLLARRRWNVTTNR